MKLQNFYQTAIAVREKLSKDDPNYKLKKELLNQVVVSVFDNREKKLTELQIQYDLIKFSSTPTFIVEDIMKELLTEFSLNLELKEVRTNFSYCETLIFR